MPECETRRLKTKNYSGKTHKVHKQLRGNAPYPRSPSYLQEMLGQWGWRSISYGSFSSLCYHLKGAEPNVAWFNGQNSSWRDVAFCLWPCRPHAPVQTRSWMPQIKRNLPALLKTFCKSKTVEKRKGCGRDFLSSWAPASFLRKITPFHTSLKKMWLRECPLCRVYQDRLTSIYLNCTAQQLVSAISHSIYWDFWRKHPCSLALS